MLNVDTIGRKMMNKKVGRPKSKRRRLAEFLGVSNRTVELEKMLGPGMSRLAKDVMVSRIKRDQRKDVVNAR